MAQVAKNLPAKAGDSGFIPGSERVPGGGNGNPLQYSCPGKSHGDRSLGGYSLRGSQESQKQPVQNNEDPVQPKNKINK